MNDDNRFLKAYEEYKHEKNENLTKNAGRYDAFNSNKRRDPINQYNTVNNDNRNYENIPDRRYRNYDSTRHHTNKYQSVNTRVNQYFENKLNIKNKNHFPNLNNTYDTPQKSYSIPQSNKKKEMIVRPMVQHRKDKILTSLCIKDGKLVQTKVFDDGTPVPSNDGVIIKKPIYTSWAAVLKPDTIVEWGDV